MLTQEPTVPICPECGTRLEGGFSRNLGRCMICLLRVGFDGADEPDEAPLSSVADRLGNYRIERRDDGSLWELGRGAMGVTYRALDTSLRRAVALKLIDSEWVKRGAEARERFMREARTAASLRHPNVATVYHFGIREENGQCFCAMELVEGETLEMRVRRTGPLDALTTIDIALQVSSALAAAEKQGLVHRDLKPANLMFVAAAPDANDSSPGKPEKADTVVKVIDFGVAKALVETPDAMGLTHGGFVGTPAFASPEQFSSAPVDVRSDIYSLGATLWFLLTGHMPFRGESVDEFRTSHASHVLPMEQLKAARVPSRLSALLRAMLAAEPAARPGVRTLTARLSECRGQVRDRRKVARRLAIAASLTGLAVTVLMLTRPGPPGAEPGMLSGKSIAVLQFESRSQDKNDAYVASGVRNEIVTKLAQVRGLRVVSCSSGQPADLRELGRKLGAANFLGASVQKTPDSILIEVQLIEAQTGTQLWSQSYKHGLTEVSEVEGEVAQKVADALQVKLAPAEAQRLRAAFTSNPRAHDLYLRAYALSANSDEQSYEQQIAMLREAVAEDPGYAEAWCALNGAYINMGDAYRAPREILLPAREAAIKAVALDDQLSYAHVALAGVALTYDWNFPVAKREFERAIALDPNSSLAHALYGWYLARAERNFVAARQEMATARRLDPLNTWPWWSESAVALAQGDYEGALRLAERVMEIYPEFLYDEDPIAHVYVAMGRWDDALKRYESIPASRFNRPNFELAICYARTGRIARARDILEKLEKLAQQRYVDHTHIAAIYAALGDNNRAFAALDQAFQDRSARVYAPRFYPWLAPLREDPRFVELENKIARSQLPQSAEVASRPFDKSIAVLPFENMTDDKANAYFADGVQEEILTSLSKVADLKVISRTSVMQFRDPVKRDLREIARQLGVKHVLEGSVQRAGNRVRVSAQLIEAESDAHLWADTFDGELADVFGMQSEIAQKIVGRLQAALSPAEQAALRARPTADTTAYDLYLRAREYQGGATRTLETIEKSVVLLDEAITRDPKFLAALSLLVQIHLQAYWFHLDRAPERLELATQALEKAARLQPDAAEVHFGRGVVHYFAYRDFARALEEMTLARRGLPNDAEILRYIGYIERRQAQWQQATATLGRAVTLDPRNVHLASELANTYHSLRQYTEERRVLSMMLAWQPHDFGVLAQSGDADACEKADFAQLQSAVSGEAAAVADINTVASRRLVLALWRRDYHAAEKALSEYRKTELRWQGFVTPREYYEGRVARGLGDANRAHTSFQRARERATEAVQRQPGDPKALSVLALIEAASHRKDEAMQAAQRAVQLLPVSSDSADGATLIVRLALVYAEVGEADRAFEALKEAVVLPHGLHYGELKLDARFDRIRADPRFEEILAALAPKSSAP